MAWCGMPGALAHLQVSVFSKVEVLQVVEGRQHGRDAAEAVAREVQDSQVAQVCRQQLGQLLKVVLAQIQPLQAVQMAYLRRPVNHSSMQCWMFPSSPFVGEIFSQIFRTVQDSLQRLFNDQAGAAGHLAALVQ